MQTLFLKRYVGNKIEAYTHTAFLKIFRVVHKQKDKNVTERPTLKQTPKFLQFQLRNFQSDGISQDKSGKEIINE